VNETPPVLSYAGSPFSWNRNAMIATLTPTNTGGPVTSCASVPTLPAGLALSSTCVVSGTPTVTTAAANYAITGTNAAGSSTPTINITIRPAPPSIAYTGSPYIFTKNSAISTITPTNSGDAITSCTSAPALPAGLSVNATTCAISGTPTAISGATNYTI